MSEDTDYMDEIIEEQSIDEIGPAQVEPELILPDEQADNTLIAETLEQLKENRREEMEIYLQQQAASDYAQLTLAIGILAAVLTGYQMLGENPTIFQHWVVGANVIISIISLALLIIAHQASARYHFKCAINHRKRIDSILEGKDIGSITKPHWRVWLDYLNKGQWISLALSLVLLVVLIISGINNLAR